MTDRPLTLRDEEVRAVLDGKKTQHRVLLRPRRPRFSLGDRLWVREAFALTQFNNAVYRADARDDRGNRWHSVVPGDPDREVLWRSPVTMPKRASRLTLVVEDVRVQRVQEIKPEDIPFEGVEIPDHHRGAQHDPHRWLTDHFRPYWNARHGRNAWRRNDWVCAIRFRPVARNIGEGG